MLHHSAAAVATEVEVAMIRQVYRRCHVLVCLTSELCGHLKEQAVSGHLVIGDALDCTREAILAGWAHVGEDCSLVTELLAFPFAFGNAGLETAVQSMLAFTRVFIDLILLLVDRESSIGDAIGHAADDASEVRILVLAVIVLDLVESQYAVIN